MYLGIDTATPFLALALWSEARTATFERELGREHGSHIMMALEQLFADADCQPADICGIGVGLGPGSYTGVRVGVATALGLARGWHCPVVGTSTLTAMVAGYLEHHPNTQRVTPVIDARRGNVYAATFTFTPSTTPSTPSDGDDATAGMTDRFNLQTDIQKIPRTDLTGEITGEVVEGIAPSALYLAQYACKYRDDGQKLEPYYL
jgi:tRNA threonylcarbamoyl adenosine modification protein YeaZ